MKELIFNFYKKDVDHLITRELDLPSRIGNSFDYIYEKLKILGNHFIFNKEIFIPEEEYSDLISTGKFREGKNYHWTSIDNGDIKFLIRGYLNHITVYTRYLKEHKGKFSYKEKIYSCFEIYTNSDVEYKLRKEGKSEIPQKDFEKYGDDLFYCKPFYDFNKLIGNITDHIREDKLWLLWNSVSIPRPKRVEMKLFFQFKSGSDSVDNIDKTIFASEELSSLHSEIFSENEMLERIKNIKVGDMLSSYKVTEIKSELKDGYFHGVGLNLLNTNFKGEKPKWEDVYSLTRWYLEYFFPQD